LPFFLLEENGRENQESSCAEVKFVLLFTTEKKERMTPPRCSAQAQEGVGGEIGGDGDMDHGRKVDEVQCRRPRVVHGHAACSGFVVKQG